MLYMSDVDLSLFDVEASKSSDDIKLRLFLRDRQSLQMSSVSQKHTYTKAKQTSVNYNRKRLNKYVDGQNNAWSGLFPRTVLHKSFRPRS